jgi:hypothetical protein
MTTQNRTLLDRQLDLLRHLTSADLIFGAPDVAQLSRDPSIRGMNLSLLRLEAEMSFGKRIGKISQVLPVTFAHLGEGRDALLQEFAAAHPPKTFRRYDDARAFYDFLRHRWDSQPPEPPFIADVARLEIAEARIRGFRDSDGAAGPTVPPELEPLKPLIRLLPSAELLRLDFDLRALFEGEGPVASPPVRRESFVLLAQTRRAMSPRIIEVTAAMHERLAAMRDWIQLERLLLEVPESQTKMREALQRFIASGVLQIAQ